MTTHSLLYTGVWGQTHLFIYLFEDCLKYVCQMSFLPENTFKLEMMDKAFAEKQGKERRKQGNWPRLYVSTQCYTRQSASVYSRVCLSAFHFDFVQDYRGMEPNLLFLLCLGHRHVCTPYCLRTALSMCWTFSKVY